MKTLRIQLNAGKIRRWHTLPIIGEQTVADHTYGVCQILRYIYDNRCPPCLLNAALDHDVPEYYTGDVPFGAKKGSHSLRVGLRQLEEKYAKDGGIIHDLTTAEKVALKWADLAEMGFFGILQFTLGNLGGRDVVENVLDSLPEMHNDNAQKLRQGFEVFLNETER